MDEPFIDLLTGKPNPEWAERHEPRYVPTDYRDCACAHRHERKQRHAGGIALGMYLIVARCRLCPCASFTSLAPHLLTADTAPR